MKAARSGTLRDGSGRGVGNSSEKGKREMLDAIPAISEISVAAPALWEAQAEADRREVARLDLAFQAAVKINDVDAIERILHPHFFLVLGNGTVVTRDQLIAEARSKAVRYEIQDEDAGTQMVRLWGDTAVVTARLRIKGSRAEGDFDRTLWFSDTYVRTADGWKYAFAQASLPLP